jgi:ATP:cob(I)alamin adenosyltransferase
MPKAQDIRIMKPSKNRDEVCYPFIHETSYLCDFEVVTDELCGIVGSILANLPKKHTDIHEDLERLQPLCFHVNGSIRGKLAITQSDLNWLGERHAAYRHGLKNKAVGFVLPRGLPPVEQLHRARSAAKKAIRAMVRVEQEGKEIPEVLPRICNLMCNFFFVLTLVLNERSGLEEVPFVSKSYGV